MPPDGDGSGQVEERLLPSPSPTTVCPPVRGASTVVADGTRRRVRLERLPVALLCRNEAKVMADTGLSRATVREAFRCWSPTVWCRSS